MINLLDLIFQSALFSGEEGGSIIPLDTLGTMESGHFTFNSPAYSVSFPTKKDYDFLVIYQDKEDIEEPVLQRSFSYGVGIYFKEPVIPYGQSEYRIYIRNINKVNELMPNSGSSRLWTVSGSDKNYTNTVKNGTGTQSDSSIYFIPNVTYHWYAWKKKEG